MLSVYSTNTILLLESQALVKLIDKLRITPVPASAGVELGTAQPQLVILYFSDISPFLWLIFVVSFPCDQINNDYICDISVVLEI